MAELTPEEYADSLFKVYDAGDGNVGIRLAAVADLVVPNDENLKYLVQVQYYMDDVMAMMHERIDIDIDECVPFVNAKVRRAIEGDFPDEPPAGAGP